MVQHPKLSIFPGVPVFAFPAKTSEMSGQPITGMMPFRDENEMTPRLILDYLYFKKAASATPLKV